MSIEIGKVIGKIDPRILLCEPDSPPMVLGDLSFLPDFEKTKRIVDEAKNINCLKINGDIHA